MLHRVILLVLVEFHVDKAFIQAKAVVVFNRLLLSPLVSLIMQLEFTRQVESLRLDSTELQVRRLSLLDYQTIYF